MKVRAKFDVVIDAMSPWAAIGFYNALHAPADGSVHYDADVQHDAEYAAGAKQMLKADMRDMRSTHRRNVLLAKAEAQLRGSIQVARNELVRLPDLTPADLDWAMLRMLEAAAGGIETRLDVCVDADRYPQSGG